MKTSFYWRSIANSDALNFSYFVSPVDLFPEHLFQSSDSGFDLNKDAPMLSEVIGFAEYFKLETYFFVLDSIIFGALDCLEKFFLLRVKFQFILE